jgi:lysophospholipase L1-like esterase
MSFKQKIYLYFKPNTPENKKLWEILIGCNILVAILAHVFFYVFTECYLITSGVLLIGIIASVCYYCIVILCKIFNLKIHKRNIKTVIITIAICLSFAEIGMVLTGYQSTYHEKRQKTFYKSHYIPEDTSWFHVWSKNHNLETDEYCFYRTTNSLGLSDVEPNITKVPYEYRIIGLGDSFTEGDGAHQDSTWLKFLERSFKNHRIPVPVTFINAGVCGSDPCFEYILLKEKLIKYQPDLVILTLNSSDIFDIILRNGNERFLSDSTLKYRDPPAIEPLYAISHLSRLIFKALNYDEFLIGDYHKSPLPPIAEDNIYSTLLLFKKLANENNFELLVVFHPFKYEIINKYLGLINVITKIESNTSIHYFNLHEYFKNEESITTDNVHSYYWMLDGHHNALGYEAFARGVEYKLNQMGIIDSLRNFTP